MNQRNSIVFFLVLSALGAVFLFGIVFQTLDSVLMVVQTEKLVVACFFSLLCAFGVLFALRPNWLKATLSKKNTTEKNKTNEIKQRFRGHHPDCFVFEHHRLICGKKTWCAGCFGLLIGCILSIILMLLYVVVPLRLSLLAARLWFIFGLFVIIIVFAESILPRRYAGTHVMVNAMFIVSFFLITVSVVELSGDVIYGFYAMILCVLWLDTRIHLSKWHHSHLCIRCPQSCKIYVTTLIFGK